MEGPFRGPGQSPRDPSTTRRRVQASFRLQTATLSHIPLVQPDASSMTRSRRCGGQSQAVAAGMPTRRTFSVASPRSPRGCGAGTNVSPRSHRVAAAGSWTAPGHLDLGFGRSPYSRGRAGNRAIPPCNSGCPAAGGSAAGRPNEVDSTVAGSAAARDAAGRRTVGRGTVAPRLVAGGSDRGPRRRQRVVHQHPREHRGHERQRGQRARADGDDCRARAEPARAPTEPEQRRAGDQARVDAADSDGWLTTHRGEALRAGRRGGRRRSRRRRLRPSPRRGWGPKRRRRRGSRRP